MCGIFGLVLGKETGLSVTAVQRIVNTLFLLSESRGKEAAGLAVACGDEIQVLKQPLPASKLIRTSSYKQFWRSVSNNHFKGMPMAIIGHSRLVTNGLQGIASNNQPVVKNGIVGVHNGIIVNESVLWQRYAAIQRQSEVDTEIILGLVRHFMDRGESLVSALVRTYGEIEGAASVGLLFDDLPVLALATNTGSLYSTVPGKIRAHVFSSERHILEQFIKKIGRQHGFGDCTIAQLKPGCGLLVEIDGADVTEFSLCEKEGRHSIAVCAPRRRLVDFSMADEQRRREIRRCTRCILPETFPMIEFDEQGVCNICREYQPAEIKGREALEALVAPYRSRDSSPDCIVALSGGRDSSYLLHYVKKELGLNPVAYSYDWGMVTDLARRNQSRLTGKLGVEHIIISADIKQKRKNIQRNVNAWLRRPSLGMIPLFMAGDKQYFYHLEQLRRQFGVKLAFLGGNPLEKTGFKTGFAGVRENAGGRTYDISALRKLQIALYYAGQFIQNPAYLNRSLLDTLHAFYSSYVMRHDFVWLFRYIRWDEDEIDRVLREEYDWEVAADTDTTWRIGDGTAAFYNYIYYTVAGFTENDALRSNQIREGMLTREEAMKIVVRDNKPRYDAMREYAYLVGFDLDEALYVINAMPKLY